MKLATFVADRKERFGMVLIHPATAEPWIFEPGASERLLQLYAAAPTSPYAASPPRFLESRPWPDSLAAFLALGNPGMNSLRRLHDFLLRFLEQADQCLLAGAGYPLATVTLAAPIPRPRFYFGLVQNSATFWRNDPNRVILNIMPQGHARPQGTVVGPGHAVWISPEAGGFSWNPEPGFIIGRGGRNIPVAQALDHVAGMTLVLDVANSYYHRLFREESSNPKDWFAEATASWLGKKTDTYCPMGPYLTTLDEVGNLYDLTIYTRQSGWLRDRSHTNSMLIGVERLISWLSSFMTLYPGDVLHMGTMGVDGMRITPEMRFGPHDYLEGEIERVGVLRVPVICSQQEEWRAAGDPGRTVHPSPAIRDVMASGEVAGGEWSPKHARHFWTIYGNYRTAATAEQLEECAWPRVLNGPAQSLGFSGETIPLPPRTHAISVGIELAFVIGRPAYRVAEDEAEKYILGYVAMASLLDHSFSVSLREPATPQERNMPAVYGRWADGFNPVSLPPIPLKSDQVRGRDMRLSIDGYGKITGNTDDYLLMAPRVLSFLSGQITLFPGDVVTLGRIGDLLHIPAEEAWSADKWLRAEVDGIGTITTRLLQQVS
jgi:2-keto-4-pentenoate hydratase/2-oxohepta-3-ene-1,7-dioic acid hydratase in catechol pathway